MVRNHVITFLKPTAATLGGVVLALVFGGLGGAVSKALLTGGDEDNRSSGIPGFVIGTLAGVLIGGFVVGWFLRRLKGRIRHLGRVFLGPGFWIWLIFAARWLDWEHLVPQLGVAAVLLVLSFIGVSVGGGRAKSAGQQAIAPDGPPAGTS